MENQIQAIFERIDWDSIDRAVVDIQHAIGKQEYNAFVQVVALESLTRSHWKMLKEGLGSEKVKYLKDWLDTAWGESQKGKKNV